MTAGYDPDNFEPGGRVPPGQSGAPDDRPGADDTAQRPGSMPPRIEPTWVTQPAAPLPGSLASPSIVHSTSPSTSNVPLPPGPAPTPPSASAPASTPALTPTAPPPSGRRAGALAPSGPGTGAYPALPAVAGQPSSGGASSRAYPRPYQSPATAFAFPAPAAPPAGEPAPAPVAAPRRRLAWPGIIALLLVLALAGVVVFQARQIDRLDREVDRANARVTQEQAGDDARIDSLEGRAEDLEKQAGQVFNPEAIATAVLPSVFRVVAGDLTGTAFAVGKPAGSGGAHLFTNYHVVQAVWSRGGRTVRVERRGESYPARIVKVDEANDVAQLTTDGRFAGLVTAPAAVKSGQQIVVVGAPLGLEDSVTTGVVSAFRKREDGTGTVIQFSAPINPGNSGGPVVNADKQVVGIATAKARDAEGIGLAVPINTACAEFKIC